MDKPKNFAKQVHNALRAWHTPDAPSGFLEQLPHTYRVQTHHGTKNPALICNQVLMEGLEQLKRTHVDTASLLSRRFLNQETAREVAYSLNVSEDVVYQRQRAAITHLADVIWQMEQTYQEEHAQRLITRFKPQPYTRLFGVRDNLTTLRTKIENETEPWILALEGLGGIGKTTLADKLARELAYGHHFHEIAWTGARQRLFHLPGQIEALDDAPILSLTELLDMLIEQLDLKSLRRQSDEEKQRGVQRYLNEHPSLVIIDNLETVNDYQSLVPQLGAYTNPSKFLLTTRYSLRGKSGIYIFTLEGLSEQDTLALIRHEAATQGLTELASASDTDLLPIYRLSEGNPLATKLIVGQVHTFPLYTVLDQLRDVQGQPAQNLLDYIHTEAWEIIDEPCRRVLQALTLVPNAGGNIEHIAAAAKLDASITATCLQRLAQLSLVNVKGDLHERRYIPHQLTRAFVLQKSLQDNA